MSRKSLVIPVSNFRYLSPDIFSLIYNEVAHAVAQHGSERMSQQMATQFAGVGLSFALREQSKEVQSLSMMAFGAGAQFGMMLPFSRLHESEADRLGLIFMAMAGYSPAEAPAFWQRMKKMSGGKQPPPFMSTHPSHDKRISDLNAQIPVANSYYQQSEEYSK